VVEKELAAARAREANMHLLLRKLCEDKPLPKRQPKENSQPDSMASQSEGLLYKAAERSRAARTCCRRLELALGAVNEENAIKLRTELDAWDAVRPGAEEGGDAGSLSQGQGQTHGEGLGGGLEEMVREYPGLMGHARVVLSRALEAMGSPSSSSDDTEDMRVLCCAADAAVRSSDPNALSDTARALRSQVEAVAASGGGRGRRMQRAATVECLRLTALLVDTKAKYLRSWAAWQAAADKQSELERAARLQLSAFVRDISLVQDLPFLQSRLVALQAKVAQEKRMLEQVEGGDAMGRDAPLASLSKSMVEDMEACVLLLQVLALVASKSQARCKLDLLHVCLLRPPAAPFRTHWSLATPYRVT